MNESWNANRYITKGVRSDASRINRLEGMARKDVYAMRQRELAAEYMTRYYRTMTHITMLTIFVTMLMLFPAAMWRAQKLGLRAVVIIDGVILLLFLVILVSILMWLANMRTDVWGQRRWQLSNDQLNSIQSSSCQL
jgi:hypothetical protein